MQQQQQHGGNINIVSSSRFSQSVINENNNAGYNYVLWLIQKLQTTNRQQQLSQKFAKAFDAKKNNKKTYTNSSAAATSTLATLLRVANYLVQRIFIIAQGKPWPFATFYLEFTVGGGKLMSLVTFCWQIEQQNLIVVAPFFRGWQNLTYRNFRWVDRAQNFVLFCKQFVRRRGAEYLQPKLQ